MEGRTKEFGIFNLSGRRFYWPKKGAQTGPESASKVVLVLFASIFNVNPEAKTLDFRIIAWVGASAELLVGDMLDPFSLMMASKI
mmetsp:Transcript_10059/g.23983  ORF Transcript_10059/g.23983 Transcript_10059/m.23983 type:complete len:85 (-) Transcript_10059:762-1016(-)